MSPKLFRFFVNSLVGLPHRVGQSCTRKCCLDCFSESADPALVYLHKTGKFFPLAIALVESPTNVRSVRWLGACEAVAFVPTVLCHIDLSQADPVPVAHPG